MSDGWPPLDEAEHATALTPEEREGPIPSHITPRGELNELEQQNILEAVTWASMRQRDPVGEPFGRNLHRRMFRDVWKGPEAIVHPTRISVSNGR